MGLEAAYHNTFIDITLNSPSNGIANIQKTTPKWLANFFKFQTKLGGGKEIMVLVGVGIIFASREKFFYYLGILSIDKLYVSYLKMAYASPRPYMIDRLI